MARSHKKQTKNQRRKKRQEKKQQRSSVVSGSQIASGSRQEARIRRQQPQAWVGELQEDIAVFDVDVRAALSAEQAKEASTVAAAFELLERNCPDEALTSLAQIARNSVYSDWRLFVRGYVSWCDDDLAAAKTAWARLDAERRPARMAAVLMAAHRPDLESLTITDDQAAASNDDVIRDETQLKAAKLIRQLRVDRTSLRIAATELKKAEPEDDLLIGPEKVQWLKEFCKDYRATEPELVSALERAALLRAYRQPFSNIYPIAANVFPGPPHDPKNNLLSFLFLQGSDSSTTKQTRALSSYLLTDLPASKRLPASLRDALISSVHLREAQAKKMLLAQQFLSTLDSRKLHGEVSEHYTRAMTSFPKNQDAYSKYAGWLEEQIDRDTPQEKQIALQQSLLKAYSAWTEVLPDDPKPRLWLMDYFLEQGSLDQGRPHADWLTQCRHEDPTIRASAWKWELLECMQLCRRKSDLPRTPEKLQRISELWPTWLSRDWLSYLSAAVLMRGGHAEEAAAILKTRPVEELPLTHAVMLLSAAQRMHVPAKDLKELRVPVEDAVRNVQKVEFGDLLALGSFFRDLQRTQLTYPAYRSHGGKLSREFSRRISKNDRLFESQLNNPQFHAALLWASEDQFRSTPNQNTTPAVIHKHIERNAYVRAAYINSLLRCSTPWALNEMTEDIADLRESAKDEKDPFYRHWFVSLADKAQTIAASNPLGGFGSTFRNMFGGFGGFEDDDDDECMCEDCQAQRRRERSKARR